jgi:formate hydrogenlyase subunit 6/NADH:ubiquinone oxidoreductase subunit I
MPRKSIAVDILTSAVSILKGLRVTIVNFFRKKVTVNYPFPDPDLDYKPRPGYRGDFALIADKERGRLRCTACMSCVRACPDGCIHVEGEGKGKDRAPVRFTIDVGLCMFCHLCVEACPFDALTMTPDYKQAERDPVRLIRTLEDLRRRGLEFDEVQRVKTVASVRAGEAVQEPSS